ncbi:MAG TPA: cytochrome c oxidase subunit 3 [Steroidobacteraceae bacterium]|jgi:cytochrome c oxidase subunit 3|nr:cytochrome c oxidase subunit 3 [Steroidobacteraceae bacterium]
MSEVAEHFGTRENQNEATEFGMWVFLATELMFFGGLLLGYAYVRHRDPTGFAEASRHTDLVIGTANTAVLLTSALLMSLAIRAAQLLRHRQLMLFLSLAALLGLLFLGLKGYEYHDDIDQGLVPWLGAGFHFPGPHRATAALFFYLYYALTAVHALHLSIAVCVVGIYLWRLRRRSVAAFTQQIVVTGLYWHFVDAMWVLLYTLIYVVGPR